MEAWEIPNVDFKMRENGEWRTRNSDEFFNGKKVILFSLPGAFTPTCSEFQLPDTQEITLQIYLLTQQDCLKNLKKQV